MKINLLDICIDGGTQCRLVIDQPTVATYVEHMKEGSEFPPLEIVSDGKTNWLTDGFHRWHAYKILGIKSVDAIVIEGTKNDAILAALKANSSHGKTLTNEDKRNKVRIALELFGDKADREIARICGVSNPFVGALRNPEVKKKQEKQRQKSNEKKVAAKQSEPEGCNPISSNSDPYAGIAPDDDEIKAAELAQQADQEALNKLLESDDALKTAHDEIKRLNHLNAQLELRLKGLMNERNEAVKMVKKLQKELEKAKK